MRSNLYLAPPTHPPRRKSPVFFLLVTVVLATGAVFVLCISRLGKELQEVDVQKKGWFKLLYVVLNSYLIWNLLLMLSAGPLGILLSCPSLR